MSNWDFEDAGRFGSRRAAEDFAKRNNIDFRDIRTRDAGGVVDLEVRRSALNQGSLRDAEEGRQDGWS